MLDSTLYESLLARLKLPHNDGCWEWQGARNASGYGTIYIGSKRHMAHRAMWRAVKGEIPPGKVICHACDNPACARPDHLFIGTVAENNYDRHAKGRSVTGGRKTRLQVYHGAKVDDPALWAECCEPDAHDLRGLSTGSGL